MMLVLVVIAMMLCSVVAFASDRSPFDYTVWTYLWVIGVSTFSGTTAFLRKIQQGAARPFNITELVGEICASVLAGLLTFWLTEAASVDKLYSAAMIAITGHMGPRALFLMEGRIETLVRRWIGDEKVGRGR